MVAGRTRVQDVFRLRRSGTWTPDFEDRFTQTHQLMMESEAELYFRMSDSISSACQRPLRKMEQITVAASIAAIDAFMAILCNIDDNFDDRI